MSAKQFKKMKWPEILEEAKKDTVVILPVGSIEQHGYHLPVDVDTNLASYVAEKVVERTNTLLLPPVYYGYLEYGLKFPGSISIKNDHFIHYIEDIAISLNKTGFRRMMIINGHGGNTCALTVAVQNISERTNMLCAMLPWWSAVVEELEKNIEYKYEFGDSGHAGSMESSCEYFIDNENCDPKKAVREIGGLHEKYFHWDAVKPSPVYMLLDWKCYTKSGVSGDATKGDPKIGKKYLEIAIEKAVEIVEIFKKIPYPEVLLKKNL
jgi:creatinine amidohydrolase